MIDSEIARKIQLEEHFDGQCSRRWGAQNRDEGQNLRIVYLYVHEGVVRADNNYANDDNKFDADYSFAVMPVVCDSPDVTSGEFVFGVAI